MNIILNVKDNFYFYHKLVGCSVCNFIYLNNKIDVTDYLNNSLTHDVTFSYFDHRSVVCGLIWTFTVLSPRIL